MWEGAGEATIEEMGIRIANLPAVQYGRSNEMLSALNLRELTGSSMGIKFVDLRQYTRLNVSGSAPWKKRGAAFSSMCTRRKKLIPSTSTSLFPRMWMTAPWSTSWPMP